MLLMSLLACATLRDDLVVICEAPLHAGVPATDPDGRARATAAWIDTHLRTAEGRAFFGTLAVVPLVERAALLEQRAREQGIATCPYADEMTARPLVTP